MIRATSDPVLLHVLSLMPPGQTLLSVASYLWPGTSPSELLRSARRFPGAALPLSPVEQLRRQVRGLSRCGLLVLRSCPAGVHCHGTHPGRCPLLPVERSPWPREVVGPLWGRVRHPGPPELSLEIIHPSEGDQVAVGRVFCAGAPAGIAYLHGDDEGIELEFRALAGRDHLRPYFAELVQLEAALQEKLVSQVPGPVKALSRRFGVQRCGHA